MSEDSFTRKILTAKACVLLEDLEKYQQRFRSLIEGSSGPDLPSRELHKTLSEYTLLVTNQNNIEPFEVLQRSGMGKFIDLVRDLRHLSAKCVTLAEKEKARNIIAEQASFDAYFKNIESCIEEEFGTLSPTSHSAVLLIGSGSLPMTLLNVAQLTGARTCGIDIDEDSVDLSLQIVDKLAPHLNISLERRPAEDIPFTLEATHIIFSSTVPEKYQILGSIHHLLRNDVSIFMRYGNGLKSIFNYPSEEIDPSLFSLVDVVIDPGHIFDVAIYQKTSSLLEQDRL